MLHTRFESKLDGVTEDVVVVVAVCVVDIFLYSLHRMTSLAAIYIRRGRRKEGMNHIRELSLRAELAEIQERT